MIKLYVVSALGTFDKQLLKERELTLDRAIDIGIANELSDRNNTELSSKPSQ